MGKHAALNTIVSDMTMTKSIFTRTYYKRNGFPTFDIISNIVYPYLYV